MSPGAHRLEPEPRRRRREGTALAATWGYASTAEGAIDLVSDNLRRKLVLEVAGRRATEPVRRVFTATAGLELLDLIPGAGDDTLKERLTADPDGFLILVACHARRS